MRVLALTKYGDQAASTRQRFVQYDPILAASGIVVEHAPLLNNDHVKRVGTKNRVSIVGVAKAYGERVVKLLTARRFDVLWIHCELFPYLPGFLERLAKIRRQPIVFDYDDAIFHMYDSSANRVVRKLLGSKLAPLLKSAHACCCGNSYLRDYAAQFCENSIVLPTVVDTTRYIPADEVRKTEPVTIGWIGSPSTWASVRPVLPLIKQLCGKGTVLMRAVGAGVTAEQDRFDGLELVDWSENMEIPEVRAMDIGIMPLLDLPFQRGKSGYKLIQYMACGLPVVASPIGVNSQIVNHGQNGFLATHGDEWRSYLLELIRDPGLRARMGKAGRDSAVANYSLAAHAPRLVDVFLSTGGRHRGTPTASGGC